MSIFLVQVQKYPLLIGQKMAIVVMSVFFREPWWVAEHSVKLEDC